MAVPLGRLGVIRKFFTDEPHGRPVTLDEFKALTADDKQELGDLAVKELGLVDNGSGKFIPAE